MAMLTAAPFFNMHGVALVSIYASGPRANVLGFVQHPCYKEEYKHCNADFKCRIDWGENKELGNAVGPLRLNIW